jgi:hypothetical protein
MTNARYGKLQDRRKTLELAISGSKKRVFGSTNQEYRTQQSLKRQAWQKEIDAIDAEVKHV